MRRVSGPAFPGIDRASLALYAAVAAAFLAPGCFGDPAYFGDDLLSTFGPQLLYFKQALSQGHWPLWCPLLFGGQPFAADPNTMAFYPPNVLRLFLPLGWGQTAFTAFHLALAAVGAHLWLRALGAGERGARVGALCFALSGFSWWEMIHPPVLAAFAWLPWWAWGLEHLSRRLSRAWAFGSGLCFALLFLAGSFQVTLGAVYAGTAYFFLRFAAGPAARDPLEWKRPAAALLVLLWSSLPLWAFGVPAWEFLARSTRVLQPSDFNGFNADLSLSWKGLPQFLFPLPAFTGGQCRPYGELLGNAGSLGPWALFLAAYAFTVRGRKAWGVGLAALAALLLALGGNFPLFRWLCDWAAGFSDTRAPFRFLFLWTAALSLSAAWGWDDLEKAPPLKKRILLAAAWVYGLFVGFGGAFLFHAPESLTVGMGAGLAGLSLLLGPRRPARMGAWIFSLCLAASLLGAGWSQALSKRGPASNFDFLGRRPELAQVKARAGLGRAFLGDGIPYPVKSTAGPATVELPTNAAYALGLRHIQGYDPLSLMGTDVLLTLPFDTLARLTALNAVATGVRKAFAPPGFREEKFGPIYLYGRPHPYPFVYGPARFQVEPDGAERLKKMGEADFDPGVLSYFSSPPPAGMEAQGLGSPVSVGYELLKDEPDDEAFQVERAKAGWTVFSEVMYPGWKAYLDGGRTPILTADQAFRAVEVPAGKHRVEFRYEPAWWGPIRLGLLLWSLSVAALFWAPWRRFALGGERSTGTARSRRAPRQPTRAR